MRRRYARYLVRSIKKQRAKGRRLPESLYGIERQLRNVPPPKQAETVEKLLEASSKWEPETAGRAVRRATTKQQRKSGKGGGGTRPGMFPGQRQRVR